MRPVRALTLAAVLLTTALTTALAGCASTVARTATVQQAPGASTGTSAGVTPDVSTDSFTTRADKLAGGWDGSDLQLNWESGYIPLSGTAQLPAGAFHSGADKAAYYAGQFHLDVTLPAGPAQQTVHFDNNELRTLPGVKAVDALHSESDGHCPTASCPTWLTVTGLRATTERVRTSQGMATVPAWAFRLQGYQGEFVYAAVKPDMTLSAAPGGTPGPAPQLRGYQGAGLVAVSPDGRTLTIGAPMGCGGSKPSGLVRESKSVVVIGATIAPAPTDPTTACAASLAMTRIDVHLSAPLGSRTVLDVGTGMPQAPLQAVAPPVGK